MTRKLFALFILCASCAWLLMSSTQSTLAQSAGFDLRAALAGAQPGDTIVAPPGVYHGPLTLDKAVILQGEGWPVIEGDGDGDVVVITAPGVTLTGFVIRGSGVSLDREDSGVKVTAQRAVVENNHVEDALFGIYYANAADGVIRNNVVKGKDLPISRRGDGLKVWYSANTLIEGNTMADTRDCVIWFSPHTIVRNNIMEHGRYGLHFMSTDDHLVEHNILRHNSVGIYLMYGNNYTLRNNLILDNRGPSGYGVGLKEVNDVSLEGNRIVNNRVGVYVDDAPVRPTAVVTFSRNLLAFNEIGVTMLPNVQHNRYANNLFLENNEQISIAGSGELSNNDWAYGGQGNYWSDYNGFDANGDQIGDLPYQPVSLYENLTAAHPELRIFVLSPATNALDLAAKAFPIFQPRPLITDPAPLTVPPWLPEAPGMPASPIVLNLMVALGMILLGSVVLAFGARPFLRQR